MEEIIAQNFTEILRKELAPIKLDILEIKEELKRVNKRVDVLGLEFHTFQVKNERHQFDISVLVENIKTAAENRSMILDHDKRIQILEAA